MATEYTFNGRRISIPGTYSEVKSGVNNQPLDFDYGGVLIIDKDPNNPFGGGSGIAGELENGENSVYEFDNLRDFRSFIRGGKYYDNALPMFRPAGPGSSGVSKVYYTRAFTTTSAALTINWTGGGVNGGQLVFKARHEGLAGNGVQGNEVKAKQVLNITNAGGVGDTAQITANSTALGVFTQVTGGTIGTTSAGIAAVINENTHAGLAHGYTAEATGTQVVVYAPDNLGATANGYTFAVAVTGTLAATVGAATMAGGVNGTKLTRGIAVTMTAGVVDTSKFILKFFRGSYAGSDASSGLDYATAEAETSADLLAESPEFNNVQEIVDWTKTNFDFRSHIVLTSHAINGTGVVDSADLAATTGNQLFSGGTQAYATARIDQILDTVKPLGFTFAYTLDSGANVQSVDNTKILSSFTTGGAKYEKFLVLAGGNDKDTYESQSIAGANFYDTDRVILVHGGCKENVAGVVGLVDKDSSYKAAYVLGRMCGLEPQTPITFKNLGYAAELHQLSDSEKENGISNGVLCTAYDHELQTFSIVHGVNTLQNNDYIINEDGTSHLISLKRIAAQLNKELEINMKRQLLGNQTQGPNRSTLNAAVVKNWVESFLKRRESTATEDNLIISFQDVTSSFDQDVLRVNYAFVPNFEVNKIFITGLIIDPSLNN